jgi:hypothetical protein
MAGMKLKTINQVLTKKVDKWLASIDDEDLRKQCKKDVIVTGGSIASMLLGEEVNDYDLYFRRYDTCVKMANYYLEKFKAGRVAKQGGITYDMSVEELHDTLGRQRVRIVVKSAGIAGDDQSQDYEYFESRTEGNAGDYVDEAYANTQAEGEAQEGKPDYHPVFLSSNAITLKGGVQIIIRFHGGPEAIHENFDFVHCMNYWTYEEGVVTNQDSLLALMSRTLEYRGSLYPVCSVFRAKKFIERGWKINAGQYLKMIMQINELDLNSFIILEEQLTGVDVAYFSEVLSKAKKKNSDTIDTAYLVEIINRMF